MRVLHLVRHGETVWHAQNRYAGHSEVPLSASGKQQAQLLAGWAVSAGVGQIVTSDLSRAILTAAPAARAAGLIPLVDKRLREVGFGRGEGLTAKEMDARFPEDRAAFVRSPATTPLPGGERGDAVAIRFVEALREAGLRSHAPTLVVAHSSAIRLALCELLGIELDNYRTAFPSLGNVAITTIGIPESGEAKGRTSLLSFNVPIETLT